MMSAYERILDWVRKSETERRLKREMESLATVYEFLPSTDSDDPAYSPENGDDGRCKCGDESGFHPKVIVFRPRQPVDPTE